MARVSKRKVREETPEKDVAPDSPPPAKRSAPAGKVKAGVVDWHEEGSLIIGEFTPTTTTTTTTIVTAAVASSSKTAAAAVITKKTTTKKKGPASSDKSIKIASFDLDSNLIETKSGKVFAKDFTDWKWWNTCVPAKLREAHADGFQIVLFTNQNGFKLLSSKKGDTKNLDKYKEWKKKVNAIVEELNLPVKIYAASESDNYRKPRTGMFDHYLSELGDQADLLDIENSVYVGDAAGRKGDFSPGDRKFAENVGIPFLTPEEYFLSEKGRPYELDLEPSTFAISDAKPDFEKKHKLELVVLTGFPASGKSTFCKEFIEPLGYKRVNQDILKTRDKCVKVAEGYLKEGHCVVIDNANPGRDARQIWKAVADKFKGVAFRSIYLATPEGLCKHNEGVRAYAAVSSMNPEGRTGLPGIAFSAYKSKFQEPDVSEGFVDVMKVEFAFRGTQAEHDVWKKHWAA
ncbi:hypothetical protein ABW20_dc0106738 [Dactylellina cionopaga]|nr:hypothetical protein ABW20_dc0106738 [Dactylellina cionopaga]